MLELSLHDLQGEWSHSMGGMLTVKRHNVCYKGGFYQLQKPFPLGGQQDVWGWRVGGFRLEAMHANASVVSLTWVFDQGYLAGGGRGGEDTTGEDLGGQQTCTWSRPQCRAPVQRKAKTLSETKAAESQEGEGEGEEKKKPNNDNKRRNRDQGDHVEDEDIVRGDDVDADVPRGHRKKAASSSKGAQIRGRPKGKATKKRKLEAESSSISENKRTTGEQHEDATKDAGAGGGGGGGGVTVGLVDKCKSKLKDKTKGKEAGKGPGKAEVEDPGQVDVVAGDQQQQEKDEEDETREQELHQQQQEVEEHQVEEEQRVEEVLVEEKVHVVEKNVEKLQEASGVDGVDAEKVGAEGARQAGAAQGDFEEKESAGEVGGEKAADVEKNGA